MSGRASGLVLRYGPADPELALLCAVVADAMDADGRNGSLGQRLLIERARLSLYRGRRLLARAIDEGWLTVDNPGGPRRQAVYSLGPALLAERVTRGKPRAARGLSAQNRADTRDSSAQNRARTVNGSLPSERAAPGGQRGAGVGVDNATPPVAQHPPSCRCDGLGWIDGQTGDKSVRRCPGPDTSATADDGSSP